VMFPFQGNNILLIENNFLIAMHRSLVQNLELEAENVDSQEMRNSGDCTDWKKGISVQKSICMLCV